MNIKVGDLVYVVGLPSVVRSTVVADALRHHTFGRVVRVKEVNEWDDAVLARWGETIERRLRDAGVPPDMSNDIWLPRESVTWDAMGAKELGRMARSGKLPWPDSNARDEAKAVADAIASIEETARKRKEGN